MVWSSLLFLVDLFLFMAYFHPRNFARPYQLVRAAKSAHQIIVLLAWLLVSLVLFAFNVYSLNFHLA